MEQLTNYIDNLKENKKEEITDKDEIILTLLKK